jgi:hypothetical protein
MLQEQQALRRIPSIKSKKQKVKLNSLERQQASKIYKTYIIYYISIVWHFEIPENSSTTKWKCLLMKHTSAEISMQQLI